MFRGKHSAKAIAMMRKHPKCKVILQFNIHGKLIQIHESMSEAERTTGISRRSILRSATVSNGIRTAGGYIWKYKDSIPHDDYIRILKESNIG